MIILPSHMSPLQHAEMLKEQFGSKEAAAEAVHEELDKLRKEKAADASYQNLATAYSLLTTTGDIPVMSDKANEEREAQMDDRIERARRDDASAQRSDFGKRQDSGKRDA